jgi:hypothetical protein
MRRKRPKSALLITAGTICIVVGVLGLICGLCGAVDTAMIVAGPKSAGVDMQAFLKREAPAWIPIVAARAVVLFLLSCLILPAGIGLLYRQPWARWAAIAYALIGIPLHLVHGGYGLAVYMPAMENFLNMTSRPPPGQGAAFSTGFKVGFLATFLTPIILWMAASVFLLFAMLTPQASKALAPTEPRRRRYEDDEDFDDDHDDRPRRRRSRDDDYE